MGVDAGEDVEKRYLIEWTDFERASECCDVPIEVIRCAARHLNEIALNRVPLPYVRVLIIFRTRNHRVQQYPLQSPSPL